jgi:hypothetical protein
LVSRKQNRRFGRLAVMTAHPEGDARFVLKRSRIKRILTINQNRDLIRLLVSFRTQPARNALPKLRPEQSSSVMPLGNPPGNASSICGKPVGQTAIVAFSSGWPAAANAREFISQQFAQLNHVASHKTASGI